MKRMWAHVHLPRLRSGEVDSISLKVQGQRVEYAARVSMTNAEFKVFQPGRQRCIREGVRNVHAWVVGVELARVSGFPGMVPEGYRRAVYDPWKGPTFVDSETLEPVLRADLVILSGKNVFYTDFPELEES